MHRGDHIAVLHRQLLRHIRKAGQQTCLLQALLQLLSEKLVTIESEEWG